MRHARAILEEQDRLLLTMSEYARLKRGTLKIGALWSLDFLGIVNLIGDFFRQVPQLRVDLVIDGSSNLYQRLLSHELDAVFNLVGQGNELDPRLDCQLLQHHRYVVAVPQGHPFWGKHYLTIQDLDGQPVIIPDKTTAPSTSRCWTPSGSTGSPPSSFANASPSTVPCSWQKAAWG